jgi:hypothetical protein
MCSRLRHCTASGKVTGLVPDGIGIFHSHNLSGRNMALGWVDSASNRNEYQEYFLQGGGGGGVLIVRGRRLRVLHPHAPRP